MHHLEHYKQKNECDHANDDQTHDVDLLLVANKGVTLALCSQNMESIPGVTLVPIFSLALLCDCLVGIHSRRSRRRAL